jgi:hypothetical protein
MQRQGYFGDLEAVAAWARVMKNFGFRVPNEVFDLNLVIFARAFRRHSLLEIQRTIRRHRKELAFEGLAIASQLHRAERRAGWMQMIQWEVYMLDAGLKAGVEASGVHSNGRHWVEKVSLRLIGSEGRLTWTILEVFKEYWL